MKNFKLFVFAFLAAATAHAADATQTDPRNDVDNATTACPDLQTDMIKTSFSTTEDQFVVTMTMTNNIQQGSGYREYYFWVDVDPAKRKGYRPYDKMDYHTYDANSMAWTDMFADYRIFMSLDGNNDARRAVPFVAMQRCTEKADIGSETDCARDNGLRRNSQITAEINGPEVTFKWPKTLIPEMAAAKTLKVGYTTYYEYGQCEGEDDSPQWGRPAWTVKLPGSPVPAPVPAPKPK